MTIVQQAVSDIKAAIQSITTSASQAEQSLIPKVKILVQVHIKALAIGLAAGGLAGFLIGHFLK